MPLIRMYEHNDLSAGNLTGDWFDWKLYCGGLHLYALAEGGDIYNLTIGELVNGNETEINVQNATASQ